VILRIEFHSGCVQGDPERNGKTGKSMKRASLKDLMIYCNLMISCHKSQFIFQPAHSSTSVNAEAVRLLPTSTVWNVTETTTGTTMARNANVCHLKKFPLIKNIIIY